MRNILVILISVVLAACSTGLTVEPSSCAYARYFDVIRLPDHASAPHDSIDALVIISPYGAASDTLRLDRVYDNIVCMSSSHVAALAEIGADSCISAVSGIRYITNPALRDRYARTEWSQGGYQKRAIRLRPLYDIGYEATLDYEKILELNPDILLTYIVSDIEPPYVTKLRSLGVPVIILSDHLEHHPLARAEYIRLFGVLTGRKNLADSLFNGIVSRYDSLASAVPETRKQVLMNIPYSDVWYVPGSDGYMSQLIRDAGGEILGASPGTSSGVITLEQAYALSQKADIWLNPGHCRSIDELSGVHQLFKHFGPLADSLPIYNNTLRITPEGGNDFWESGSVRPDRILEDLSRIFAEKKDSLNYFFRLD